MRRAVWSASWASTIKSVEYDKPKQRPDWMSEEAYRALPNHILVREIRFWTKLKGGRTREITLVTTLLDPKKYPAEEIGGAVWPAVGH